MVKLSKAQRRAINKQKQIDRQRNRTTPKDAAKDDSPTIPLDEKKSEAPRIQEAAGDQALPQPTVRPPATRAEYLIACFTAVLTIFAIVQGIAMIAQNDIMKRQMEQTDETIRQSRLAQRPWLAASVGEISPLQELLNPNMTNAEFDEWHGKWTIHVRNVGQTPATNIRWQPQWHPSIVDSKVRPFDFLYERQQTTTFAIRYANIGSQSMPGLTLNPGDTLKCPPTGFRRGSGHVYFPAEDPDERVFNFYESRITGAFVYNDIWGDEHTMFCCFRHNGETGQLELEECTVDYPSEGEPPISPPSDEEGGTTLRRRSAKELLDGGNYPITDLYKEGRGED